MAEIIKGILFFAIGAEKGDISASTGFDAEIPFAGRWTCHDANHRPNHCRRFADILSGNPSPKAQRLKYQKFCKIGLKTGNVARIAPNLRSASVEIEEDLKMRNDECGMRNEISAKRTQLLARPLAAGGIPSWNVADCLALSRIATVRWRILRNEPSLAGGGMFQNVLKRSVLFRNIQKCSAFAKTAKRSQMLKGARSQEFTHHS